MDLQSFSFGPPLGPLCCVGNPAQPIFRFARPGPPPRRKRRPSLKATIKAALAAGAGQIAIGKAIIFPPGAPAAAVASDDFNEWDVVLLPRGDHGPH
jgi:hypothetical protein